MCAPAVSPKNRNEDYKYSLEGDLVHLFGLGAAKLGEGDVPLQESGKGEGAGMRALRQELTIQYARGCTSSLRRLPLQR